jgi:hypothetical protein
MPGATPRRKTTTAGGGAPCRRAWTGAGAAAWHAVARSADEEKWAAKCACARLSDSHVAAFRTDGFMTLRQERECVCVFSLEV